jgi:hypothetical protein
MNIKSLRINKIEDSKFIDIRMLSPRNKSYMKEDPDIVLSNNPERENKRNNQETEI